jgi:hypothetical protein
LFVPALRVAFSASRFALSFPSFFDEREELRKKPGGMTLRRKGIVLAIGLPGSGKSIYFARRRFFRIAREQSRRRGYFLPR